MIPGYFLLKVAGHCNLSCNYCFAQPSFSGSLMDPEVMDEAFRQIDDLGLDSPKIGWHGGEPTLYGVNNFRRGLELQASLKSQFHNGIQTNATLIDTEWVDLLRHHCFAVGVSIDGPEAVHNRNRPMLGRGNSYQKTRAGLDLLLASGVSVSVISVISKYADPASYFELVKSLGVSGFDLKPCTSGWEGAIGLESFTIFQEEVFRLWLENDDPALTSRVFAGHAENCLGGTGSLCSLSGHCGNFITIDTNGDVYPCDELLQPEFKMGNLIDRPLKELFKGRDRKRFEEMVAKHQTDCSKNCDDYQVCRGGCTSARHFYGKDRYCDHLKEVSRMIRAWTNDDVTAGPTPTWTPEHGNDVADTGTYMNIGQGHGSLQTRYAIGGIEAVEACYKEVEEAERTASLPVTSTGDDNSR